MKKKDVCVVVGNELDELTLCSAQLSYFASPEMTLKPLGTINVKGCRIERDNADHKQRSEYVFVVLPPGSRVDGARIFFLSAESENDMNTWILELKKAAGGGGAVPLPFANPAELLSDQLGNKFHRALKEGALEVQDGRGLGKWRTRFVVCRKNVLLLFESKDAVGTHNAVTVIPLLNASVEVQQPQKKLLNNSAYRSVSRKVGMESRREFKWNIQHGQRKHFLLSAPNDSIMADWIAVCAVAVGQKPVARLAGDESTDSFLTNIGAVSMSGELVLQVQGRAGGQSAGERKFVVLSENILFFCRDSKSNDAYNAIDLENASVKEGSGQGQFLVTYMHTTSFSFDCRSANLRAAWIDAIARGIELGKKLNIEARVKLNNAASGKTTQASSNVVREVEQFSEDKSKYELPEDDYATTQALEDRATTVTMAADLSPAPPAASAPQRPVWGKKPSKMLAVRESKAVGQYRKPALDKGLRRDADSNDDILDLLNDPIFSGERSPRKQEAPNGSKANTVCMNCGLVRLEVEANFCDGCGMRFTAATVNAYDDDDNMDDVVSLDDSEKAFLAANGTSEAELVEVKRELVRVSTMPLSDSYVGKEKTKKRVPPGPPLAVAENRRSSRVSSGDFRPQRNSVRKSQLAGEDDDSFYTSTLPPLPATMSDSDSDDVPTPPPRSSVDKRKMQLEAKKKKLDDDDPLALLVLLDWDEVESAPPKKPVAKQQNEAEEKKKKQQKERERLEQEEREEEEEREAEERRRKAEEKRRADEKKQKERERARESEDAKKEAEAMRRLAEEKRRLDEKRQREREREAEEERLREQQREAEEEARARDLREREEKLRQRELELMEMEREALRKEEAAQLALREAEELKRRARLAEEEKQRREEEARVRKEEEARQRAAELARREREAAEAREKAEREAERLKAELAERAKREAERRLKEEELERKEAEMRQRAADLARREREAIEAKREAERRKAEDEMQRKEEALKQRAAEAARREKEAIETQERARREADRIAQEAERNKQEAERQEALERSRKARDAAKRAKEAKERELAEVEQREEAERRRQEQQQAAFEEAERLERLKRIEEERKRKEAQEERDREEQRRKEAEWAELRAKMDKQREKEAVPPPAIKRGPKFSAEDTAAIEKLKMLLANEFIERKEYDVRMTQILSRYPANAQPEEKTAVVVAAPVASIAVAEKPKVATEAVAQRDRGKTVNQPCVKCGKPCNVQKKFCPHCGYDAAKAAAASPAPKVVAAKSQPSTPVKEQKQQQQQKERPVKIPTGLKSEDLESCLKLRELLDNDLLEVAEYNSRVKEIAARSSVNLESVARSMEARVADEHLDEFSRVLEDDKYQAQVRATTAHDDDDAALLRSIGLSSEPRLANQQHKQQKTVHDEGLSELDLMLKELGE